MTPVIKYKVRPGIIIILFLLIILIITLIITSSSVPTGHYACDAESTGITDNF